MELSDIRVTDSESTSVNTLVQRHPRINAGKGARAKWNVREKHAEWEDESVGQPASVSLDRRRPGHNRTTLSRVADARSELSAAAALPGSQRAGAQRRGKWRAPSHHMSCGRASSLPTTAERWIASNIKASRSSELRNVVASVKQPTRL